MLFFWRGSELTLLVQPLGLFGKCEPAARNILERLFDAEIGAVCRALLGFDSATAIVFSTRVHLIANNSGCDQW